MHRTNGHDDKQDKIYYTTFNYLRGFDLKSKIETALFFKLIYAHKRSFRCGPLKIISIAAESHLSVLEELKDMKLLRDRLMIDSAMTSAFVFM